MNILYDFSAADPVSGGAASVCRWFATRFVSAFPDHKYYAFTADSLERSFHAFRTAEDGDKMLVRMILESKRQVDGSHLAGMSQVRSIYRNSLWTGPARFVWRRMMSIKRGRDKKRYPCAVGMFERACIATAIDVIHCPAQQIAPVPPYHLRTVPYVMNLHDLQHEHFPEFFSQAELERRRIVWYASARASRFVVAAAKHVQDDIVCYTGIARERVPLIPWGVPFDGEPLPGAEQVGAVMKRYALPEEFILYPAVTWIHKNHVSLLEAISAVRREKNLNVNLVLTGSSGPYHAEVLQRAEDLGLTPFVRHLGVLPLADLKALYCLATGVVIPSLHEQTSGPLMEAMAIGCPVASSNIADHAELLADGAGFLFDPMNISAISECIRVLYKERQACKDMAARAKKRINQIRSWRTCAGRYMELYEVCRDEKKHQDNHQSYDLVVGA